MYNFHFAIDKINKNKKLEKFLLKKYKNYPPKLSDVLVVFGTGAYNFSMSSNYNRIPRPAGVLVLNGQAELVQRRELPEDLLRYDLLPDRFSR